MVDNDPNKGSEQSYEFQKKQRKFSNVSQSGGTEDLMSILRNKNVMYTIGGIIGLATTI